MRWSVVIALVTFLAMADAQLQPSPSSVLPDYSCSDSITKLPAPNPDPCSNTSAYAELGKCASYMAGNVSIPPADCCTSAHHVWSTFPACFCKVTFQSKFPGLGPALARARPQLCNITDNLCSICPAHLNPSTGACSARIAAGFKVPDKDPCTNTTAYSQLGACGDFMAGNMTAPTAACCSSVRDVWSKYSACFCKVTFFSKFLPPGPSNALARPQLCNITDDMCNICPKYFDNTGADNTGGHKRKINIASVITIDVIVTLAVVGCLWLLYLCKKKAPWKPKQNPSKDYVPQFNNL